MQAFLSVMGLYNYDDTIFDDMELPESLTREVVIAKILIDNAELGLVYSDPEIFPMLVQNWSRTEKPNWERMITALNSVYNPVHNYDRYEEWEDENSGTGTNSHDVAGFNDNANLVKESKDTADTSMTGSHSGHMYGNIGVTTAMQMIREEVELREDFNIYQIISDSFKRHFCVMVY